MEQLVLTDEEKLLHRLYKKGMIEETFEGDPLYQQLSLLNTTEKLFETSDEKSILELDFTKDYSTKQAAGFVGKTNQEHQLTNLLARADLGGYFQVSRIGSANRCRYDWKAIFRFKLFFLLAKEAKLKPLDIAAIIRDSGFLEKGDQEVEPVPDPFQEEIEKFRDSLRQLTEETSQLKKALVEGQQQARISANQNEKEAAKKEARLTRMLRGFLSDHYRDQGKFLREIREYLEAEPSMQKKEKSFFGWRDKTDSTFSSHEELLSILEKEESLLKQKIKALVAREGTEAYSVFQDLLIVRLGPPDDQNDFL